MKKFLVINLIVVKILFGQISPGELSKSHSKFEGLDNCTKCHTLGEGLANQKCLDCHKEIKVRIEQNSGYHSSSEVKGKDCWKCHSEHNGKNFKLINFNPKSFDHRKTGYELTGKHKSTDCGECHQTKFIKDKSLKKDKTYLGLDKNCISCHEDVHQKSAGDKCENCHNTTSFNQKITFDHNRTNFPLLGAHNNVKCSDCHKKSNTGEKTLIRFVSMKKILCTDCHTDVHENKFGQNCLNCHNYNSFKSVSKKGFDHRKTGFPLIGKHQFVECKDCHKGKLTDPLKHNLCIDCHKDYHQGQFTKNGSVRDCNECHSEKGFSPSLFTLEMHQKTKFVLTGSHLAVECKSCHYKQNDWKFKVKSTRCVECHQNVHNQEISFRFFGKEDCENCHNTTSWDSIKFDHNQTKFVLTGKHSEIRCGSCHIKVVGNQKIHLFKSIKSGCLDCHNDFHYKQYASNQCLNCHNYNKWIPTTFDHNQAEFKLTGAHEKVECMKCHPTEKRDDGGTFTLFKTRRVRCSDCHLS
jgi:hypothetical protein